MLDLESWLERFTQALRKTFGERVWFAGLQGSYARGEATESSDIDPVVILDALTSLIGIFLIALYYVGPFMLVAGAVLGSKGVFDEKKKRPPEPPPSEPGP